MAARHDSQARIRAEAAEWMVRLVGDPALKDDPACRDWLARDPAHARAFSDARRGWEIAAEVGASVRAPVPQRRRFRRPLAAGLGLATVALAGLWLNTVRPDLLERMTADHVTAPGPVQVLVLSSPARCRKAIRERLDLGLTAGDGSTTQAGFALGGPLLCDRLGLLLYGARIGWHDTDAGSRTPRPGFGEMRNRDVSPTHRLRWSAAETVSFLRCERTDFHIGSDSGNVRVGSDDPRPRRLSLVLNAAF
ncbi:FecR/PupR family sigma factor regulator [Paracoccus binzhouensis]|uniref:FecR/PupR family sigma factor regulator n=1 Tax=Paracoccus binzhouensis TaxID=2796149 RepID=UPI0018EF3138|nr:DUF4880 domain-containing protein [Paracoccus binzhouensis]